ncbi:hypothetical protein [Streptomyces sp. NPDC018031]|uniref:phosphorylase family protein n=1 Tax=Streptomyces sp. NPDC018031 TaxID=3365033 RepID=UPI00379209A7
MEWSGAGRADVVVLTALEVEYRAVRAHLHRPRTLAPERGSLFEVGTFRDGASERPVALHMTGPGNPAAAVTADRAIGLFAPRAVLFVGVAGGVKDVALGDVVAAESVYDYETGKDTERGFRPRMKTHHAAYGLVQLARLVAAADDWRRRIGGSAGEQPRALVKPIAAGGRVVAHERSRTGRRLALGAGDAVAVDMEGFGFLTGAHLDRRAEALVIRGISDLLGDKSEDHDDHWQPLASRHAAAFAFELISRLPSGGQAAGGAAAAGSVPPDGPAGRGGPGGPGAAPPPAVAAAPRPAGGRHRLTIRELSALTDLLLAVPGLAAPARWQQLLDELPVLGGAVSRQSASRPEALSLLRTCEEYGAWGDLLEVVAALAPDAPATAALRGRVADLGLG